jgi:hypothetical protein
MQGNADRFKMPDDEAPLKEIMYEMHTASSLCSYICSISLLFINLGFRSVSIGWVEGLAESTLTVGLAPRIVRRRVVNVKPRYPHIDEFNCLLNAC